MDINTITLVGRIAADPKFAPAQGEGSARISFRLAVGRNIPSSVLKTNPNLQQTDYIECVAFGKAAENHARYLSKGKQVAVRGSLNVNERDNADGTRTWFHQVRAVEVSYGADSAKQASAPTAATTPAGVSENAILALVQKALQANGVSVPKAPKAPAVEELPADPFA